MKQEFPGAVPEIPVTNVDLAAEYYESRFGFVKDWGGEDGGIAQVSKGDCRIFLANRAFREQYGNAAPVLIWLNLNSKQEVDDLYETWSRCEARIVSKPESKPWKLHEFTAADLDGNLFRVFYDFSRELADRGEAAKSGPDAVAEEIDKLQGTWKQITYEKDGVKEPTDEQGWEPTTLFTADTFVVTLADGRIAIKGTFKLDPTQEPKTIDWTDSFGEDAGKTFPAIYWLEGDLLVFCAADEGQERPTEFRTRPGQVLRVSQRVSPL